ncbi:oocyte zinc finger protein XlCOF6-like isoform X2 [Eurosta solidaginis]|uniref:oocyte zinc finger protein XlCOF6-like isoform X2 n=1 Tax=Eurosta solidaginis TaxID=178769 RepID=UPI003530EE15
MQCRACRSSNYQDSTDMSYVVPNDGKTLYDYFNECTQLKATNKDELPKILCINCTQNLQQAYIFRTEARKSDEELKRALLPSKTVTIDCDLYGIQSEMSESNNYQVLSVSPIKAAFVDYPEISNVLQVIDPNTFELQPASTKNGSSTVQETTEQSQVLEDITVNSPIDPLSSTALNRISTAKPQEDESELDMFQEEIKAEFSCDIFENSNKNQLEESLHDDKDGYANICKSKITWYGCDYCKYKCSKQIQLKDHIFEQHKDTIICCKCCKVFELPKELQLHKKLVHEIDSPMCCPWCANSSSMLKKELAKHLQKKHNDVFLKYFPRVRMLRRGDNDPYPCNRCKKCFTSVYELADHMQEHKFNCPICTMTFKKKATYKQHIKRVHNQSLTSLKTMPSENNEKHTSDKHKERTSNSQNVMEDLDHTSSMSEDDGINENFELVKYKKNGASRKEKQEKRDANKLRGPKKYICSYCPREFVRQKSVKLHEKKVHLCEKPAQEQCPICQKDLDATYIKTHITNVHNSDRNLACDICGDLFTTTKLLATHKQLHIDRKHPCTVCNKRFIFTSELRVHMRMHTGEEPFQCHLCEQRFKLRGSLNYHLQQHAGVKRKCKVCGKEFDRIEKLKVHSYTHTGMPYRCYVCDYKNVKRESDTK